MHRYALLLLLGLSAACGDLTNVPPPPVPLSALEGPAASAGGSIDYTPTAAMVRLVRAAPPGALLTAHLPDIGGAIRRFKKTSLYELFDSPEFAEALGPLTAGLQGLRMSAGPGPGGIDPQKLLRALQGEFLLSIEDVELAEGRPPAVRLLAALTVRGAEAEAEMLLEFLGMAAASDRTVKVEKGSVGGAVFTRIVGRRPVAYVVEAAVYGDALLIGVGRETVTAAIERLENESAESMEDDPSYVRAMERCGDPKDALRVHVDVQAILSKFGHVFPEELRQVMAVLGLEEIRAFAGAIRIEGKDFVVSSLLDSPGGKDLFSRLLQRHAVNREFLRMIPADAASFSIFPIDAPVLLRHLRKTLPPEGREALEAGVDGLREAGLDLERDVLEVFGPRCALVTVPFHGVAEEGLQAILSRFLSVALVVEVQDTVLAEQLLGRLPKRPESWRRLERTIEGTEAVLYRLRGAELPLDFALCYAQVDGYLILALSEDALRRMLEPRDEATVERYRELVRDVPETVSVLSYEDTAQGLGILMQGMVQGFLRGLASSGVGAGGLPTPGGDFRHLMRNFGPTISYTISDERGTFTRTRSPTAGLGGTGGLSGLFVTAAIALPNLAQARAQANEAAAVALLRHIRTAEATFRATAARDSDVDGEGEFGFLCELGGQRRAGDRRILRLKPLLSGLARDGNGNFRKSGYYFRAYLPAEDGSPIGGHESAERLALVDGDLAESIVVVVAWPVNRTTSGRRAFLLDASGDIWACENGSYGGDRSPPPDVLSSQAGNLASAPIAQQQHARDGRRWTKLRE